MGPGAVLWVKTATAAMCNLHKALRMNNATAQPIQSISRLWLSNGGTYGDDLGHILFMFVAVSDVEFGKTGALSDIL